MPPSEADAAFVLERFNAHAEDPDYYEALLSAAIDEVHDLRRAAALADAAWDEGLAPDAAFGGPGSGRYPRGSSKARTAAANRDAEALAEMVKAAHARSGPVPLHYLAGLAGWDQARAQVAVGQAVARGLFSVVEPGHAVPPGAAANPRPQTPSPGEGEPAELPPPSATASVPHEHVAALADQVRRRGGGSGGLAHLGDVRDALGWDDDKFAHALQAARARGVVTLTGAEGRQGLSDRDRRSVFREGGHLLLYASLRDDARFSWEEGKHPRGEHGHWSPAVHVPDDPKYHGKKLYSDVTAPGGAPVRGTPIPVDHPVVPDHVYHVTTNLPAVLASGHLRAAGEGGLGGDKNDAIVSMTTDARLANQIASDLRFAANLARKHGEAPPVKWDEKDLKWTGTEARGEWGGRVWADLTARAGEEGWEPVPLIPLQLGSYGLGDLLRQHFTRREGKAGWPDVDVTKLDPQFWDAERTLLNVDPAKVGVIKIPKDNLRTGAMLTDFDHGNKLGLREVRLYGDVPLSGHEVVG